MNLESIVSQMTLRQKAAQLTQFAAPILDAADQPAFTGSVADLQVSEEDVLTCGSTFNIADPATRIRMQEQHIAANPNHIPLVFMQDVIHGLRTIYPIPLAMAATFDSELVEEASAMAAEEASALGVDVVFSPMVDMSRDARWGRVMEGAGEDVHLNCVMAAAQVKGYKKGGVEACVKHYAGYGAGEAGRDYNTVDMSEARLREHYLPAYKAAIDAGASSIMPSFNSLNGMPSVANKLLMQKILREEWKFDGLVVSDYGAFLELVRHGVAQDEKEATRMALENGCDLEMMSACCLHTLQELLDEGGITMEQIDARVLSVLQYKQRLGLFAHPEGKTDAKKYSEICLSAEHRALACKAAEDSAVLLKNDGILPLSASAKKIAVIGPFADDGRIMGFWAVNGKESETVTILQGIQERLPDAEVRYCAGCTDALYTSDTSGIKEAEALASWADQVILVLGESGYQSGESQSRARLELSFSQLALFRAVQNACSETVVLLMSGRPLAIPELAEQARAILCLWQPGTEGGHAAARLLYGDAYPGGHLPMSFPYATGQEPISYDIYSTGRYPANPFGAPDQAYATRWQDVPLMPLYPFGYGLSYTTFELQKPTLDKSSMTEESTIQASVILKNTGNRVGSAVVQLYIHDCVGSVVRPIRELKAFEKVALAPGEEKEICFTVCEEMLRFQTAQNGFASEPGTFEVFMALDAWGGEALHFTLA